MCENLLTLAHFGWNGVEVVFCFIHTNMVVCSFLVLLWWVRVADDFGVFLCKNFMCKLPLDVQSLRAACLLSKRM